MADPVQPRILVFFDYACPFCYLDWPRFKKLRAENDVELFLVPFELRPGLAASGVPISEIGPAHSEHVEAHMRRMAEEGGLEIAFPDFMPNSHKALALGELARDAGPVLHERVHEALFAAYNGRAEDIGDVAVLLRIATDNGLDPAVAADALGDGRYDERLHQFFHLALSMGISATPAALICNELLIGSRPYALLAESLRRCTVGQTDMEDEGAPPTIAR